MPSPFGMPDKKKDIPEAFIYRAEEDEDKKSILKEQFEKFFQETSFTALVQIYNAKSLAKRLAWLVVVLAMLSWLCVQCWWLLEKYFQYPTEVNMDLVAAEKLEFPSVTVCNLNPLRESSLRWEPYSSMNVHTRLASEGDLFASFQERYYVTPPPLPAIPPPETFGTTISGIDPTTSPIPPGTTSSGLDPETTPVPPAETTSELYATTTTPPPPPPGRRKKRDVMDIKDLLKEMAFNKWDMLENENVSMSFYENRDQEYTAAMAFATFSKTHNKSVMVAGGHKDTEFLIGCKMAGFACSPRNFTTFVSHKYGNCFTFNAEGNGEPIYTQFSGPAYGLTLELYLDQSNYIAALAPAAGARVLIHRRGSMPFPEDQGISIQPSVSTSIGLRQVEIIRLIPPHGVCATKGLTEDLYSTEHGTFYSKLSCLKSCYQALVIKYCGCARPQYILPANASVCDMTNSTMDLCTKGLPDTYPDDYSQCDTNCPQPCSETRYEKTLSSAQWPSEKYKTHMTSKVQQSNYLFYGEELKKEDFAKVEIYFEDLLYKKIEQQRAYESQNVISDIGGQLGLWLGLSAITFGELFSFFFSMGKALTRGCVRKKPKSSPVAPVNPGY